MAVEHEGSFAEQDRTLVPFVIPMRYISLRFRLLSCFLFAFAVNIADPLVRVRACVSLCISVRLFAVVTGSRRVVPR